MKKSNYNYKTSHKLNNDTIKIIITLYPHISGTAIYKILLEEKYINKLDISLNTVSRYLKLNNLKSSQIVNQKRRMFEMKHINNCWQSDTSDGPYLTIGDKSRLVTGYNFFLNDTAINMQYVLKMTLKHMVN